jgi:hypothetical protein
LIAFDPAAAVANSDAHALACHDPSLASQEASDDTDINRIVELWVRTGIAPQTNVQGLTGDFTGVDDYRTMLDKLNRANAEFSQFPAEVRSFFKNDPANLVEAIHNPAMKSKLQEFGIVAPEPVRENPVVPPTPAQ